MKEKDLWWKIAIVAGLLTVSVMAVYPLEESIKLGIDLRGGYSLQYEIDDSGLTMDQKRTLSTDVMRVLKDRVDPNGVLNLVWRPIGTNRLEVQMPRPPASVSEAREKYILARDKLAGTVVRRGDIDLALSRQGEARTQLFDELVRGVDARREMLNRLGQKWDAMVALENTDVDDTQVQLAEQEYQAALDAVMNTNVQLGALESTLEISRLKKDPTTGKRVRRGQVESFKARHPSLASTIGEVVDSYDDWNAKRGREGTLDDPADLQRLLRGAGVLEYRILADPLDDQIQGRVQQFVQNLQTRGPRRGGNEALAWYQIEQPEYFFRNKNLDQEFDRLKRSGWVVERYAEKYYVLAWASDPAKALVQDLEHPWKIVNSYPTQDESGKPAVSFTLDESGGSRFYKLTSGNLGKQLCVFLDGMAVSSANINSAIRTRGIITGSFSPDDVRLMCQKLDAGSLPSKLKEPPISIRGIGPSLGEANRTKGINASIVAFVIVVVFMLVWYNYSGGLAVFALILNLLLMLAVLSVLNATLTLAGIAGMVLAIGMAVDANVLINERILEEIGRGINVKMAIKQGYERAFSAILDSNVTTILTCVILYAVGRDDIRGFALTLGWGVVINLVTAVYVTRIFFDYMELPRVPREVVRYPLMLAGVVAGFGALLYALGYFINESDLRHLSVAMYFGRMFVSMLVFTGIVLALAAFFRGWHRSSQHRKPGSMPVLVNIGTPSVNWYGGRKMYAVISLVIVSAGVGSFLATDDKDKYDIEFLGGTSAQIELRKGVDMTSEQIAAEIKRAGEGMNNVATSLENAEVVNRGGEFAVTANGVPAERLANVMRAQFKDYIPRDGIREVRDNPNQIIIRFNEGAAFDRIEGSTGGTPVTLESVQARVRNSAAAMVRDAAEQIADAQVQADLDLGVGDTLPTFNVISRVGNRDLVVDAILSTMKDKLTIQPSLTMTMRNDKSRGDEPFFPITGVDLAEVINDPTAHERVADMIGGVAIVVDDISPPQPVESLEKRLRDMRLQPGQAAAGWRQQRVVGIRKAGIEEGIQTYSCVAVLVADENYPYEEGTESAASWRSELAEPEVQLATEAFERQTSLNRVTQFAPQVASESKDRAYAALVLSWVMIIVYLGIRFGSVRWGLAAVAALVHDALVAGGFLMLAHYFAGTTLGDMLGLRQFRIDLSVVAALLTVIGYSVNDTIIVFDRIRENRGRLGSVNGNIVNESINQTLSRTVLTALTTLIVIVVLYAMGGEGIHAFAYVMLIGIVTGTYSSIAIASPLLVALTKRAKGATA